ncbi:p53 apoptosis effector related to PMP-22-like isoform X1 [Saccostrea cucullata]|uniref:p53 apoptosis effector related to PMP-22-like isoform X1 n=1 Tax=Saccostrea cuccullata TaxID=36930 RepID=UPI002ED29ABF
MSENVIIIRPFKIIGEAFTGIAGVFLIIATVGQDWVEVQFFRTSHIITWGLWDICVGGLCLPDNGWIEVCQALSLVALLLCLGAFICGFVGLCIHSHCSKRLWFILAGAVMSLVALLDLLTLIMYPIMFNSDIVNLQTDRHWHYTLKTWNFDWTYGFGWGAFIFTTAASIFFILPLDDKKIVTKPF